MIDESLILDSQPDSDSASIIDVTAETFQTEVLDRSQSQVVMVDFWADWCGPCKSLTPVLEKLAVEFAGSVVLAKVNADQEQALAGHFGIRSLPTVLIVHEGAIVDHFMGAQPESEVREMLSRYAAPGQAPAVEPEPIIAGEALNVEDLEQALNADPENNQIKMKLAVALAQSGQHDKARNQFQTLPESEQESDQGTAILGQLELLELLPAASSQELAAELEKDPANVSALQGLGVTLMLQGDHEKGFDLLLSALKTDRDFEDQLPRRSLISAFKFAPDKKMVSTARRKMSSVLF